MENENKITCPVCSTEADFGTKFCHVCAWVFEYFAEEPSEEYKKEYTERLELAKKNWNTHNINIIETPEKEKSKTNENSSSIGEKILGGLMLIGLVGLAALGALITPTIKEGDYIKFEESCNKPGLWKVKEKKDNSDVTLCLDSSSASAIGAAATLGVVMPLSAGLFSLISRRTTDESQITINLAKVVFKSVGKGTKDDPYIIES